jgi:hypothetical protein
VSIANGASITGTVLNLAPANSSFGGVVTNGAQTFAGVKTFNSPPFMSGASITLNTVPPTSINYFRFQASKAQLIPASTSTPILWTNVLENTSSAYTNGLATGIINVNTDATYSITVTGTWSAGNVVTPFGITVFGGIRILLSTGFTYMGVTALDYNGFSNSYISTVTAVLRLTTQTFTVQAYNATTGVGGLTFDGLIEILRIGG